MPRSPRRSSRISSMLKSPGRMSSSAQLKRPQATPANCCSRPAAAPLGQHPINPVGRFAHVFQHQDGPLQGGKPGVPIRWVATVRLVTTKGPRATPANVPAPGGVPQGGQSRSTVRCHCSSVPPLDPWMAPGNPAAHWASSRELVSENPNAPFGTSRKAETGFENAGGAPATANGHHGIHRWIVPG